MLNLYDPLTVPGVTHVTLYRDDEHTNKFYMVCDLPSIAHDDDNNLAMQFILYARDVDRLAVTDLEIERGYLALTTQVAVSEDDKKKILEFLREKLASERSRFFSWLGFPLRSIEPELSYPQFVEGTVQFAGVPEGMSLFTLGSKEPSLNGTNTASFTASVGQEGAEFLRQTSQTGKMPLYIAYELSYLARIPAITIHVSGDQSEFYQEIKEFIRTVTVNYSRTDWDFFFWHGSYSTWTETVKETRSLSTFKETFHSLHVDIDNGDFRGATADAELTKKVEDMAMKVIQEQILPSFFQPAIKEIGADKVSKPEDHVGEIHTETVKGHLDVWFKQTQVIKQPIRPNAILANVLTPEDVKKCTAYIDLSNTQFQELAVTVNVNVNFVEDPVFAVKVFLDYDQQDEQHNVPIKRAKEMLFKTSEAVQTFRQIMAKGADGAVKDTYNYWSEITYKDSGETIRVPASGSLQSRERQLVISYRRLGFVKVNLLLGTMPDNVRSAKVAMRYPGITDQSAEQTFELTKGRPSASFFTYTGETGDLKPYLYKITYILAEGQQMEMPEASSQSETLTIADPFEETVTTRFLAQADFTDVDKVIVDAQYNDEVHDLAGVFHAEMIQNGDTVPWALGLRDPNKKDFNYKVIVVHKNGSREEQVAHTQNLGGTIPVGAGATGALEVTVIGSLVEWTKYSLVIVSAEYDDGSGALSSKNFTFRKDTGTDQTWKVLLRDQTRNSYRYRIRFFGINSADNHTIDWTTTTDTALVIPNA